MTAATNAIQLDRCMRERARRPDIETARSTWAGVVPGGRVAVKGRDRRGTVPVWDGGSEAATTTAASGRRDRGCENVENIILKANYAVSP